MDVIVIGGGIAGLAAAFELSRAGAEVTLLEAGPRLGGLGSAFDHDGRRFERFYHSMTASDDALLDLMQRADLGEPGPWRRTTMGMIVEGEHYDFSSAMDLLRFSPLRLDERIRLGIVGTRLRHAGRGVDLDAISAEQWLRPQFGDRVWEQVIRPLFTMKFGDAPIPARYLHERLARESTASDRAYPQRGYQGLADGLAIAIERQGGRVLTSAPVRELRVTHDRVEVTTPADVIQAPWAVCTLPLPLLRSVARDELAATWALPELDYMGVVVMLALTTRGLDGHYWSAIIDSDTEFDGQIEMSALTGTEHFGGLHATYLMAYTDRGSERYRDPELAPRWRAQFLRLNDLHPRQLVADVVFRAPFVEPVWPLGYAAHKPSPQVGDTPLFLATTAQAYPRITSWDTGVRTAGAAVEALTDVAARTVAR